MITNVNIHSSVAVYVQIENEIQFAIAAGRVGAGDKLPSVRELSERISVNPNTVAKAYRDLEVMGMIYTRRGMGVYVSKGIQARCKDKCRKDFVKKLHEVTQEAKASGMKKKTLMDAAAKCLDADSSPYDEVSNSVLASVKGK